jgi:hypothetical protein
MRRVVVSVTTDSGGAATAYSPPQSGVIHSVAYIKPGAGSYDDGVDFTITNETTGGTIWTESNVNATAIRNPRTATHTTVGVAATLDGTVAALDKIAIARSRIKIVIAQGGNAKVGAFHFLIA